MGLLSAMNKSVGGLNAQSFALENISGNIANSQTTAFKRTDTSFEDLVQSGTTKVSAMSAGNVRANARSTVQLQGAIEGSATETFMGVKGNGYFVVKQKVGEVDGATVFGSGSAYTRRGDFQLDREGYLVNGSGYFLAGLPIDATTNNPVGDTPDTIQVNKDPIAAEATTTIEYRLNLPATPTTTYASENTDVEDADQWIDDDDRDGPPATGIVLAEDSEEFEENSISGGAVTAYDETGNPVNIQLRWAKTGEDTWQLYYQNDADAATGEPAWTKIPASGADEDFNFSSGALSDDITELPLPALDIGDETLTGLTLNFGTDGITQFANTSGAATVRQLTQDGLPAGDFVDVSISDGGRVIANYSNGKTVDLFQIPLVSFQGEAQLRPMDGGAYAETRESGPAVNNASGLIVGSSLEASNVDISEEFTKLIVTQQAFSANSKVISTADQMMSDILNIIR